MIYCDRMLIHTQLPRFPAILRPADRRARNWERRRFRRTTTRAGYHVPGRRLLWAESSFRRCWNCKGNIETGVYIPPLHIKANNEIFVVDDSGRQMISARGLLNRWIVPMDRRVD